MKQQYENEKKELEKMKMKDEIVKRIVEREEDRRRKNEETSK